MTRRAVWQLVVTLFSLRAVVLADVTLPAIIGPNMVLQAGMQVPIYGWADAGEKVTVRFRDQAKSCIVDRTGRWCIRLAPMAADGPNELTIIGKNTITLANVLVGEVWVCSGQSNMAWPVRASNNAEAEIAAANYPRIRLFTVALRPSLKHESDTQGSWVECSPQTVPNFTAVGYFFGRILHEELNVPVGLINSSWGGTACEAWTSREALEGDPSFRPVLQRWSAAVRAYPEDKTAYEAARADWKRRADEAKAKGEPFTEHAPSPPLFEQKQHMPGGLFNGMISPLVPYAIRGVIWYQGESNVGRAYAYRRLLPTMIRDWRDHWGQGPFAFLIVQLANFMARKDEPLDSAWAELREAQTMTAQTVENTSQAVTIDIGEENDIHPKNKQDVGKRLALIALARTYGKGIEYSGPMYHSMTVEGNKIRIKFTHADGLTAKNGGPLKGFAIAGDDKRFVWAEATIDGSTVVVSSPQVPRPVAVRYNWADNPEGNLYNSAGLPACPFRTDKWTGVTEGRW